VTLSRRGSLSALLGLSGMVGGAAFVGAVVQAALDTSLVAWPHQDRWPLHFWSAGRHVQQAYRFAANQPNLLAQVPCYCGCVSQGHNSLLDCFIRAFRLDGSLRLDPEGFGEGVCVATALQVLALHVEGMPITEIRDQIDQLWQHAGRPTPTWRRR